MSGVSTWLATILVIAGLLVGGLFIYGVVPREVVKEVTKEVKVPVDKIVEVEKVVNNTVTVEVEVETDYKQKVVDALLTEVSADKALRNCSRTRFASRIYETDEITVKKVYDGFKVTENTDGDLSVSDVNVTLNYDDGKCYRTLTCGLDTEGELVC